MADPEQIYQEVLQEEQGKGVTPVVAEGRAKSARARAEEGSPHPKEPKWWPGAQPHFEGGDAGGEADEAAEEEPAEEEPAEEEAASVEEPAAEAPAEEPTAEEPAAAEPAAAEPAAEEPAAEEPAAEEPAAEEPAAEKPAEPPAEAPAEKPAEAPAAEKPAAAPKPPPAPAEQPAAAAAQPAAAAAAAPAQPAGTLGVSHGTATGIRLRPEDEVSTEAQFEGQEAMYERRKLIDELVATGVPAVTAQSTDRPRTPWLAVLYLLIPLLVIFYLAGREDETVAPADGGGTATESPAAGGGALALVAEDTAWDTKTLTFKADEPTSLEVENRDPTVHNMSIYPDPDAASAKQDPLFTGLDVPGGETVTYEIDPLKAGEYTYICGYHSIMVGDLLVE